MYGRIAPWLSFAAALSIALVAAVGCGGDDKDAENEVQLSEADNGKTVEVAKGGKVIVSLASNPTTGYSWAVIAPEPTNLELEGEPKFVPAGSTTPVVGAGGTEVFTFEAKSAGTSTLKMGYSRPFEPGAPPEKTFSVTVTVK